MSATGTDVIDESREQIYGFFFYGTLLVPAILARVLGRDREELTFQDALLEDYTRHCIRGADYPAIIHKSQSRLILPKDNGTSTTELNTRGTLVHGLTYGDIKALDVFEGSQYKRIRVSVQPLTAPSSEQRIPQDRAVPSIGSAEPDSSASRQAKGSSGDEKPDFTAASEAGSNRGQAECWTYVWKDDLQDLQPQVWSFDAFMRDKASFWMGVDTDEYADVDQLRGSQAEPAVSKSEVGEVADLLEGRTLKGYPDFGHGMLKYWKFRRGLINLNHGSYGSPPRPVVEHMHALSDQIESFPDLFMRRSWLPLLNDVRREVASLIGAQTNECVIVPNATHGINTIVSNIKWQAGDIIVIYSTTYGAVAQMMKCVCDFHPDVRLETIDVDFPCSHESILQKTEALLERFNSRGQASFSGTPSDSKNRVKLVLLDSIASNPGVIYPWEGIVHLCKTYDVLSLVDAAHSIGQIETDVKRSDPDFWVSNCHKWLMSHRGVAVMYAPLRNQHLVRTTFPTSAGYESERYPTMGVLRQEPEDNTAANGQKAEVGQEVLGHLNRSWSFERQYEWTGTIDWTPFLSVTAALGFRRSIGGEQRIMKYCHSLAVQGGKRLSKRWGTRIMDMPDDSLTAAMVNVEVPFIPEPRDADEAFLQRTYFEEGLLRANRYAAPYRHAGKWWARFSAQVWVELDDFDKVAEAIEEICEEMRHGKHLEKGLENTGTLHAPADLPAHDA